MKRDRGTGIEPKKKKEWFTKPVRKLAAGLFWLTLWQAASMAVALPILLPPPLMVMERLIDLGRNREFWQIIGGSFLHILQGFFLGTLGGMGFAVFSWRFLFVKELIQPAMGTLKAIPVASFIILALVWVKSDRLSILCSAIMVLPVVYYNIYEGIGSLKPELLEMAQVFRFSKWKKFRYLYVPAVIPFFLSAITSGMGFAWKAGIAAEVLGHPAQAIGSEIYNAKVYLETADLFAWTLVVVLLSIGMDRLLHLAVKQVQKRKEREILAGQEEG